MSEKLSEQFEREYFLWLTMNIEIGNIIGICTFAVKNYRAILAALRSHESQTDAVAKAVEEEREACASIAQHIAGHPSEDEMPDDILELEGGCDSDYFDSGVYRGAAYIRDAIRARSSTPAPTLIRSAARTR